MYLSDRFGSSRESWPTYKGKWNQTEIELNKTIQKCWVNISSLSRWRKKMFIYSLLVCVCMCVCFELFPYEVPTDNTIKELIPVLPFLLGRVSYPIAWIPATVVHIPFQGCREYREPSPASCDSRAYGWLGEYPFTLEARGQYLWVWEMPKQRCVSLPNSFRSASVERETKAVSTEPASVWAEALRDLLRHHLTSFVETCGTVTYFNYYTFQLHSLYLVLCIIIISSLRLGYCLTLCAQLILLQFFKHGLFCSLSVFIVAVLKSLLIMTNFTPWETFHGVYFRPLHRSHLLFFLSVFGLLATRCFR